jgi:hypothetical protein
MISFDLSAIDIVLTVAIVILFVLYFTRSSTEPTIKPNTSLSRRILPHHQVKSIEEPQPMTAETARTCPYSFGYLANLPKNAAIPDSCLSCPRMLGCSSETS